MMKFVISLTVFGILAVGTRGVSFNDMVSWVKTCIGLQYRRALPSPMAVAKSIVHKITRIGYEWINTDRASDGFDKQYLKTGEAMPAIYFGHDDQQKKCHGLLVDTPLPQSIYQKLRSGSPTLGYQPGPDLSDDISVDISTRPPAPLIVEADADGQYINTVTNYVKELLKNTA